MANNKSVILFLLALLVAPFSYGQSGYAYTGAFSSMMNNIVQNTPGVTSVGITDGVKVSAVSSGTVTTPSGIRIPVPNIKAEATISKATMAANAARLVRGATVIGAAYEGYKVYEWIKESGIKTCPPPDFFCKPAEATTASGQFWIETDTKLWPTREAACTWYNDLFYGPDSPYYGKPAATGTMCQAFRKSNNTFYANLADIREKTAYSCPTGSTLNTSTSPPTCSGVGAGSPYTDAELESGLIGTGTNWDPSRSQAMRDAILADNARQKLLSPTDIVPKATPVAVTAPPVTSPETTTKTRVINNPDGTTSTETTKEKTTVTVGQPGPTIGDGEPVLKPATTISTTVTNNTTNNTYTDTETVTPGGSTPAEETPDFCALNPGALACEKLGEVPEMEQIQNENKQVTLAPDSGWGASNASCPAPRVLTVQGKSVSFSFELVCDFASGVRPLFLAFAWLSAAYLLIGATRKG